MKKVYIKFDPYNMKSTVVVDGNKIHKNKHCDNNLKTYLNSDVPMPIQNWIDPISRDNWKGLLHTLCQMGDKDIVIEFSGRNIDYQDIQNSLNAQNETMVCGANLTFNELVEEIPDDNQMSKNISDVIDLMLAEEFAKIVESSGTKNLISKYKKLKKTYDGIDDGEFRIVFTGTYSSGKSSIINALIGKNILPTAAGTCTSKLCKIINDNSTEYIAKLSYSYKEKNKEIKCTTETEIQDAIKMVEDNVEEIAVYTNLGNLYPKSMDNNFRIVIIDTPGTDSAAGNDTKKTKDEEKRLSCKSHIEITKSILSSKQKEMIVFVSDDKVEDDNIVELLDLIEESASEDNGTFNERFLFVMNMCDSLEYSNEGETLENYIKNFISNLKKVPNSERIRNIVNPRVFPLTSGAALAVVNGYTEKPSREERASKKAVLYGYYENFCKEVYYEDPQKIAEMGNEFSEVEFVDERYSLERQSSISEYKKYEYNKALAGELSVPERIMIHSGMPALQVAIQEYILHYAYPIKVRQLLECFKDILAEIKNENKKEIEELEQAKKDYSDAASSKKRKEQEKVEEEKQKGMLESINGKMALTGDRINEISDNLTEINIIRGEFYDLKNSVADQINGRKEIPKVEGDKILSTIGDKIDVIIQHLKDAVVSAKSDKKKKTEFLYKEFMVYIEELKKNGFLKDGSFNLEDTVEYREIIDKERFTKAEDISKSEINHNKEHVEVDFKLGIGYGIGNFFGSIKRAWDTRKEPDTVTNHYININQYMDNNINPLEVQIDQYIKEIKDRYKSDIDEMKENATNRIKRVSELVSEKIRRINIIKEEASGFAQDKEKYEEQIKKLESDKKMIDSLIERIHYTQF